MLFPLRTNRLICLVLKVEGPYKTPTRHDKIGITYIEGKVH